METLTNWKELTFNSLNEMGINIMEAVPNVIGALLILLIGWIITKIIVYLLRKVLHLVKVDKLTDIINEKDLFGKTDLKFNVTSVIVAFVKWIMFLVFLIVASDIMNWEIVSVEIGKLLSYLPKLFSALALFMVGLYIASFIKKAIRGLFDSFDLSGAKIISSLVFYVIAIIITVTALNQAGIDTDIITNNLTIILGAFLATIAIGFGLGSKDIVSDLLKTFYTRKSYEIGQAIQFNNISGTIESINSISITLKTASGRIVVPIKDIVENQIEIKE
ncbi:MAG: mechanosensitive ion channel [Altibacter sp.]|uniref:mechanosensitive ion channel family protein n=1 Tax=Altibacter sp. TaxID=2024823 RepID=UPI001D65B34A|nr:mechanosensitive ion channel domain-containing protein [Altibacter sp.]MBZ0326773.1 mechanosensitive ion channel [Altibacter sp.]